uniref:DUF148 domain-containing protein n=1 Tax=Rhabditophanes sp. KR3021 TaxID=114890 RepID=A0AC35TKA3_9BILA
MAFPHGDGDKDMFDVEGKDFYKNVSTDAKKNIQAILTNKTLSKQEIEDKIDEYFNNDASAADKAVYEKMKPLIAAKEAAIIKAIDDAVNNSSLTPAQKALYASFRAVYTNKELTFQETRDQLKTLATAADQKVAGDSKAVEKFIMQIIKAQVKSS